MKNFIDKYLPLIKSIAKKYKRPGIEYDDLIQEGMIGLWEAKKRFNPHIGTKFSTYATFWIKKNIIEAVNKEKKTSLNTLSLNEDIIQNESGGKRSEVDKGKQLKSIKLPENFPELEKEVLTLLFGLDDNEPNDLKQISIKLNISRERVRQIKEKALRRLRNIKYNTEK